MNLENATDIMILYFPLWPDKGFYRLRPISNVPIAAEEGKQPDRVRVKISYPTI